MLAQIKSGDDDVWASMHTSGHLEGDPSDALVGRLQRMRNWIEGPHFPDAAKVEVQSNVSEEARTNRTEEHKRFLSALSSELAQCEWTDSAIGDCIRKVAAKIGIGRRDVYTTIYWVMLGKNHGPRASSIITEVGYAKLSGLLKIEE